MMIMQSCKKALEIWGLLSNDKRLFLLIPYTLFHVFIYYGQYWFFMIKTPSVFEASMVLYVAIASGGLWVQMLILFTQRRRMQEFFNHFEKLVNSLLPYSPYDELGQDKWTNLFMKTEERVTKYGRWYGGSIWICVTFYNFLPAAQWIYYIACGTLDRTKIEAPFNDMYRYFDATNFPTREIVYAINVVAMYFIVQGMISIDLLYMANSLYLVTMFDYQKMLLADLDMVKHDRHGTNRSRSLAVVKCARIYMQVLDLIDQFNDLFGGVVFVQFIYSTLSMVTCVLTALYSDPSYMPMIVFNILVLVSELYLYNLMGTMVVNSSNSIKDAVYSIRWYEYSIYDQKSLFILMLRTYRNAGLGAYRYFICSHETFAWIMSKVYSSLTFLRKMVE